MTALAHEQNVALSADILWTKTLDVFRDEGKTYALQWLAKMNPLGMRESTVVLSVPDLFFRDWVDDHYRKLLESTFERIAGQSCTVTYEVVPEGKQRDMSVDVPAVKPAELNLIDESARPARINPRFTFSNYVVADSNQLPAAAAAAVADSPGRCYNPLFIYGGTGLGKTHLLHAIGNKIFDRIPGSRIVYLSSEDFTNEYVESVRDHRMTEFRRKFRDACDVLLIDDIQFLGRREETQKEFFYTFNALHEMGKAIVLTSDTVPAEIPGLEDRLRSRFAMGLITDIQEPNYETRMAILKKKAEQERLHLPEAVCQFIAKHIQKNVRELEGALVKVSAVHSLTGQPVTEEFCSQVLKDILPAYRPVDADQIFKEVSRFYKVSVDELKQDKRTKHLAHARQVAMYLCRKCTKASFPDIGKRFGKDHSTVISAVRKVESSREMDPAVKKELEELEAKLGVN